MKLQRENLPQWMKNWDYLTDIEYYCNEYSLDPRMLCALIQTESSGIRNCVRYEDFFKYLYKPEEITSLYNKHRFITYETILNLQKTSFGIMQCMGSLFFEYGFHLKTDFKLLPLDMCNPILSLEVGCIHLRKKIDQYKLTNALDIYAAYNAGSVRLLNGKYKNQSNVDHFNRYYMEIKKILLP